MKIFQSIRKQTFVWCCNYTNLLIFLLWFISINYCAQNIILNIPRALYVCDYLSTSSWTIRLYLNPPICISNENSSSCLYFVHFTCYLVVYCVFVFNSAVKQKNFGQRKQRTGHFVTAKDVNHDIRPAICFRFYLHWFSINYLL